MEDILATKLSLVKNFESIQAKIEQLLDNNTLDIKQISDLERYINMQDTILDSLNTIESIVKGEF